MSKTSPYIIDIEASGFGPFSYPIEVGVALNDAKKHCSLIAPADNWTFWDEKAEAVHHISKDCLHKFGKPIKEVADSLNALLKGQTLYSDGWVVDKPWLTTLFYEASTPMLFFVSPIEMILSEQQMSIWQDTKNSVIAQMNIERHRASNDAAIIQETYRQTYVYKG